MGDSMEVGGRGIEQGEMFSGFVPEHKQTWIEQVSYAESRYGPFTSTHEGYGVLAEEVAELLDAIRGNDIARIRKEAIQVSAVAFRIATSLDHEATRGRSKP